MASRASRALLQGDDRTCPSSHTTYGYLTNEEMTTRLHRVSHEKRMLQQQLRRLQTTIAESTEVDGVVLNEELHDDVSQMMKDHNEEICSTFEEGSFQRLFWEQQKSANLVGNSKSVRWHPLIIKWCLYLRHLSGNKAYELLRDSGCIKLPSQRTLRDYTHYIKSQVGFSVDVDHAIVDAANLSVNLHKYVTLVMDEMYIKSDLVYDKHEGTLIGFVNMGDINTQLLKFEATINNEESTPSLASTMMVFMVKGMLHKFDFPYAQFACHNITGELMFDPMWEAVARLERIGFFVLALCCDGASPNRRLWKLHSSKSKEPVYRVPNIFARDEGRYLYFISDPPHLIKTIRNSWCNKQRKLWVSYCIMHFLLYINFPFTQCNGKRIDWQHLTDIYQQETFFEENMRLVPKLKFEHLNLTSYLKMRVDLAAWICFSYVCV